MITPILPVHILTGVRILGVAALLSLSACNKAADRDGDGEVSRDERASQIPEDLILPLQAGLWQRTVTFSQIKVPGLSEKKKRDIMARMSKAASGKACLSQQQAPRPPADFFGGGRKGACKYRKFSNQKDAVQMALSCEMDGMAIADMDMQGVIKGAQFDFDVVTELRLPMAGKVELVGKSLGRFLGACSA